MKKLLNKILLVAGVFAIMVGSSCKKVNPLTDLTKASAPGSGTTLTSSEAGPIALALATKDNPANTFQWSSVWYGTTTPVTYTLQYDSAGFGFLNSAKIYTVPLGQSYSLVATQANLNGYGKQCGIAPTQTGTVEFRIMTSVGTNGAMPTYSNIVSLTLSIYDVIVYWGLPGKYQGWDNTKPLLGSSDLVNYEGYVYCANGTSNVPGNDGFKIVPKLGDWSLAYGDGGGDVATGINGGGNLSSSGGNIMWPGVGNAFTSDTWYFVQANTTTWTAQGFTSLSVIGDFNSWGGDVDMTYNPVTNLWTATVPFTAGGFKIRWNHAWTTAFGAGANPGSISLTGGNITAPTSTKTLTLDLSHPIRYTYSLN